MTEITIPAGLRTRSAPPYVVAGGNHVTVNASDGDVRFMVAGAPGEMTSYFAEAGVLVAGDHAQPDREPPGPAVLIGLATQYGIRFWGMES
jgi:hypothetical protein